MFKYVDDTNLLVPENTDISIGDKFSHVKYGLRRGQNKHQIWNSRPRFAYSIPVPVYNFY